MFFSTSVHAQDSMLCVDYHWSEDQANLMMKKFGNKWDDNNSWEDRAEVIRKVALFLPE
jgi:hypothetical protein